MNKSSHDNSIFYMSHDEEVCKASTRGYMRLKVSEADIKWFYVGDGAGETFSPRWGLPKEADGVTNVLMTIQPHKMVNMRVIENGKVLCESMEQVLDVPAYYKELSLEEMKIMHEGLGQMISHMERLNQQ